MSGTLPIDDYRGKPMTIPSLDGWLGFFARSGVFAVLFVMLLWFLRGNVFLPMQEENRRRNDETALQAKAFQDAIIKGSMEHAANAAVTAKAITSLEENSRNQTQLIERQTRAAEAADQKLQKIYDATIRGAWNEPKPKGGP